jgi:hypothetical protein
LAGNWNTLLSLRPRYLRAGKEDQEVSRNIFKQEALLRMGEGFLLRQNMAPMRLQGHCSSVVGYLNLSSRSPP